MGRWAPRQTFTRGQRQVWKDLVVRSVLRQRRELAVAPEVDPSMAALPQQRIPFLVEQLVQQGSRHPGSGYVRIRKGRQATRIDPDEIDVLDGSRVVAERQIRLGPKQDQLLVANDRDRC